MNWKEFFKPSWQKFAIFLMFLSLYLFSILIHSLVFASVHATNLGVCTYDFARIYTDIVVNNESCNSDEINKSFTSYQESINTSFSVLDKFVKVLDTQRFPITLGLGLPIFGISGIGDIYGSIILILYWYLLSCSISWIIKKVKKK